MSLKEERFNLRIYGIDNRRSPWKGEQLSRCQLPLHHELNAKAAVDPPIRSKTGINLPPSISTGRLDGFYHGRNLLSTTIGASPITGRRRVVARMAVRGHEGGEVEGRPRLRSWRLGNHESSTCVTLNGSGIQLAVGPQPLRLRNHNFGLAQRIMVKRLATSPHDPIGITDSACKNHLVVVSVQYGPFNSYIPIRSTTIGKSRVARDPIAMHTSWRLNSDIASVTSIGYPRMRASGESSTTKHRLQHASGPHPIPPPNDPKTNQYNQDLGLIHSTNGNHLESPNEGSSIDHQVTIHLHAQNITMFPTNETWYFTSQMLVSSSGGFILILTVQSTRNEFRIHSDY
ncbi:cleavage stimulation factor subunit 2-like [Dorcoceras hygrometricum]|uniref:Cleavage stimulation factor subunit 2-like n=1 Tax=Dorcoceras hygrometricum TaxID=472368 RepID=A0A2Z7D3T4_9LAMI|nr:cleavage stimulation factor subunit 2-like [Dorcoceras hygrometricum]